MLMVMATLHAVFLTVILFLLINVPNIYQAPFFTFLIVFFFLRAIEFSLPSAKAVQATMHGDDQSRFTTWILSASFITNIVIPVLQYRYTSPAQAIGWMNWLGLAAFIAGSALRLWSMRVAGESFKAQIAVAVKQRLVTIGPYARVRHPSYLGVIIAYAGIAGIFSSSFGVAALLIFVIPALVIRLLKEEKILAAHFGEEWQRYTAQTGSMLIPGL